METVDLIASGYEWTCPHCDARNKEIEISDEVTCWNCEKDFKAGDAEHAFH